MFISARDGEDGDGEDEDGAASAINISFSSSVTNKSRRRNKLIDWLHPVSLALSLSFSPPTGDEGRSSADPTLVRPKTRRPSPNLLCHDVQLSDVLKTGGTNFSKPCMFFFFFSFLLEHPAVKWLQLEFSPRVYLSIKPQSGCQTLAQDGLPAS